MNQITVTAAPSMSQSTARLDSLACSSFVLRLRALRSNACPRPPSFRLLSPRDLFFFSSSFSLPFRPLLFFLFSFLTAETMAIGGRRGRDLTREPRSTNKSESLAFRNILDGKMENVAQGGIAGCGIRLRRHSATRFGGVAVERRSRTRESCQIIFEERRREVPSFARIY